MNAGDYIELLRLERDAARAQAHARALELEEARAELLSATQQLELEREAGAQLRAELGERMRETAEAQREACAVAVHLDVVTGSLSPAAITRACRIIQKAPLVTDTKASGGTP